MVCSPSCENHSGLIHFLPVYRTTLFCGGYWLKCQEMMENKLILNCSVSHSIRMNTLLINFFPIFKSSCTWSRTSGAIETHQWEQPAGGKASAPAPNLWFGETQGKNTVLTFLKILLLYVHFSGLVVVSPPCRTDQVQSESTKSG